MFFFSFHGIKTEFKHKKDRIVQAIQFNNKEEESVFFISLEMKWSFCTSIKHVMNFKE